MDWTYPVALVKQQRFPENQHPLNGLFQVFTWWIAAHWL
jgi:hypothetical protein